MNTFTVIGYLNCGTTIRGFLRPVYQRGSLLFFHKLDRSQCTIIGFDRCANQNPQAEITPISQGPQKKIGDSTFFVFKDTTRIITGSCDDVEFLSVMDAITETLENEFLLCEIQKILRCEKVHS